MRISLFSLFFSISLFTFGQNKKEQIEQLNNSIDSLKLILNLEREDNLKTKKAYSQNIETLHEEKAVIEKQRLVEVQNYNNAIQDLDYQLRQCKKQLDSLQLFQGSTSEDPESYLFYLKNDYLRDIIKAELDSPNFSVQNIGSKSFLITHLHDAGTHSAIYWEVEKTTLYPRYNIEYGGMDWDSELAYIFENIDTKFEERGTLAGTNADYLMDQVEKKIEKFILSGK